MMRRLAAVLFALSTLASAPAQERFTGIEFEKGSGIAMKVTSHYDDIPPSGMLPIRIEVANRSASPRRWDVLVMQSTPMQGASSRLLASVEVPARSERSFELLAPLLTQGEAYRYSTVSVSISGYGVRNPIASINGNSSGRPSAYTGVSKTLYADVWEHVRDRLQKKSLNLNGSSLDLLWLPDDWRALAGFDKIVLTADDWLALAAEQRSALSNWLILGGDLYLVGDPAISGLPAAGRNGVGRVIYWPASGDLIALLSDVIEKGFASPSPMAGYSWSWKLVQLVGRPVPPFIALIAFIILFAVIVGPVNFLLFAPAGHRHRLFWTTPLISLSASILLILLIILSEGFGGKGKYVTATMSLPSRNQTVIWQEQVSRTGVLAGQAFPVIPGSTLSSLPLSDASLGRRGERGKTFSLSGMTWSGDWFQSRRTQAQRIEAIAPSRERVEIRGDEHAPQALSTFGQPLNNFFYFDNKGSVWFAAQLKPGKPRTLAPSSMEKFAAWKKINSMEAAGGVIKEVMKTFEIDPPNDKFFAAMESAPLPTLSSLKWTQAGGVVFGEVLRP
ncbi:hypothetical protein DB345_00765 [Spartobacteria bacterium LR76]|nr:hypothetical protein DB345_00765 [Spartobacteria bacterium LR76]